MFCFDDPKHVENDPKNSHTTIWNHSVIFGHRFWNVKSIDAAASQTLKSFICHQTDFLSIRLFQFFKVNVEAQVIVTMYFFILYIILGDIEKPLAFSYIRVKKITYVLTSNYPVLTRKQDLHIFTLKSIVKRHIKATFTIKILVQKIYLVIVVVI